MATKLHPNDPQRLVDFAFEMGPHTAARDLERLCFSFFLRLGECADLTREQAADVYVGLWDTARAQRFAK